MSRLSGLRRSIRRPSAPLLAGLLGLLALVVVGGAAAYAVAHNRPSGGAVPAAAGSVTPAFADSFDGQALDPTRWRTTGVQDVALAGGALRLQPPLQPSTWGAPGLYSVGALARQAGRTLVSVARPEAGTVRGPFFMLAPSPAADPATGTAGYGSGFDSLGGDDGNGGPDLRLSAITPEGRVLYDPQVAQPVDYLLATTLRATGSYHFVSGGAFGTFPEATLVWVGDSGSASAGADLYVGVDAKRAATAVSSVKVVDLPGAFASPFGLAKAMDGFHRPAGGALGRTEGGALPWRKTAGDLRIASGGMVREGSAAARASIDPGLPDGIFEMRVRMPAGPFASPALYFRYKDERNWWRFRCRADGVEIGRSVAGVESVAYQTGTVGCASGGTYRLIVRAHGPRVNFWLNGTGITFSEGLSDETLMTASGIGVGVDGDGPSPLVEQVVAWPKTVTLPTAAGPAPSVAASGAQTIVQDTFSDAAATRLQDRRPDSGGPWREYSGTWVVGGGRLVPTAGADPTGSALAAVAAGRNDMAAALTLELIPATAAEAGQGWVGGPVVRYTDGKAFIWARLVQRAAGSQLELWESNQGVSRFIGVSDVTTRVSAGSRHVVQVAALGQRVAAYLDDALLVEGETSVLDGAWGGLLIAERTLPATLKQFRLTSTAPDRVAPPPVAWPDSPAATFTSPTASPPALTWLAAVDDASQTRFYRVFRSTTPGALGVQINRDGETTETTYQDSRLPGGGTYCYTVVGVDGAGNGSPAGSRQRCFAYGPAGAAPAAPAAPAAGRRATG